MDQEKKKTHKRACHIRFPIDEWAQLLQDRDAFRISIAQLLRGTYFKRQIRQYLMSKEHEDVFFAQWNIVREQIEALSKRNDPKDHERNSIDILFIKERLEQLRNLIAAQHAVQL